MRRFLLELICASVLVSSLNSSAEGPEGISRATFTSADLTNTTAAAEARDRARARRKKRLDDGLKGERNRECVNDLDCAGYCVQGVCQPTPRGPQSSIDPSVQRRVTEIYLRERGVQLRQDLALGEGPVISALAATLGVSAPELGRMMRSHREVLAATLGDRADQNWPTRFLDQLETLRRS